MARIQILLKPTTTVTYQTKKKLMPSTTKTRIKPLY